MFRYGPKFEGVPLFLSLYFSVRSQISKYVRVVKVQKSLPNGRRRCHGKKNGRSKSKYGPAKIKSVLKSKSLVKLKFYKIKVVYESHIKMASKIKLIVKFYEKN